MQTNQAVEQNENIECSESPWNQSGEEKVYGGKDLPKNQVLSSEWKSERRWWRWWTAICDKRKWSVKQTSRAVPVCQYKIQ